MNITMPAQQKTKSFFYALCALVCLAYAGMKITFYDAFKQLEPYWLVVVFFFLFLVKEEVNFFLRLLFLLEEPYFAFFCSFVILINLSFFFKKPKFNN